METALKPQKRNTNLVPLSREHHFGLLFGWKIKQGLANKTPLNIIRNYVLYFWQNSLQEHLLVEEVLLEKVLPETDILLKQMHQEHDLIRELIMQVEHREELSVLLFEALHILVTEHIRFEERQLFPHVENTATPEQLRLMGEVLVHEYDAPSDDFLPAFWEKKRS